MREPRTHGAKPSARRGVRPLVPDVIQGARRALATHFLNLPRPILARIVGTPPSAPDGIALDLQTHALLWLVRASGEPEIDQNDLARARRQLEQSAPLLAPLTSKRVLVRDRTVEGAIGPRRARVYTPGEALAGKAPGMVYFHGGGFVLGSIDSHDRVCRSLASQAGVIVVSVDYRLAPEHPFPAGVDDAIAATRWVLTHGDEVGIDVRAVAVGGDSAGGNLAAVAARALCRAPQPPAFQLLVYPSADATRSEPSHRQFADGFLITARSIDWFLAHYVRGGDVLTDPRLSPVFADDLTGLAPALVLTAGFDPLRDEACTYAKRMRAAGADVEYVCFESSIHGFLCTAGAIRESARAFALAADRLRRGLLRALART